MTEEIRQTCRPQKTRYGSWYRSADWEEDISCYGVSHILRVLHQTMAYDFLTLRAWTVNNITKTNVVIAVCIMEECRECVAYVVEGHNKAWKKAWQRWVVFETLDDSEEPWKWVLRWLNEELDLSTDDVTSSEEKWDILFWIQDEQWIICARAKVFLVILKTGTRVQNIHWSEIQERWIMSMDDLQRIPPHELRPWTLMALEIVQDVPERGIPTLYVKDWIIVDKF